MVTVAILLIVRHYVFLWKGIIQFPLIIIIFYTIHSPFDMYMKVLTAVKEERPLLLAAAAAAAAGRIFFTVTPAAYAHDLTKEDILSLQDQTQQKVTICHIPNGNPDNAHEITVGESAVAGHVQEHGDGVGPCQPTPPDL
jgi:hypothetical protein